MMATTNESEVLKRASVEGRVQFQRGSATDQVCICCPKGGGHIFARSVVFNAFETDLPEHFGRGANEFMHAVALQGDFEGKRVRLTVEVLAD